MGPQTPQMGPRVTSRMLHTSTNPANVSGCDIEDVAEGHKDVAYDYELRKRVHLQH